jgi:pimeloyl-ACP methyl ester carboxylesterase
MFNMAKSYTAVVYFHGIGTQRRHEEISRLIDAIDQYSRTQDAATIGNPRGQEVNFEVSRIASNAHDSDPVSFIEFHRRVEIPKTEVNAAQKRGEPPPSPFRGAFRIYEGYWSSLIAQGLPAVTVLKWLVRRTTNPILSLFAPWRSHQRLKLAYLYRLQSEDADVSKERQSAYQQLADSYIAFESWDARRLHEKGRFREFLAGFLPSQKIGERRDFVDVQNLAKRWHSSFVRSQLKILFAFITLFVGLIGAGSFALFSVAPLISAELLKLPFADKLIDMMPVRPRAYFAYLIFPILAIGYWQVSQFLRTFVSDVVFWTAREGSSDLFDVRQKILNQAIDNLLHVIRDPRCKRVVVIGHSLGSSIGYQALLQIGRRREAMGAKLPETKEAFPFEKISHFITLGSPIETLHYFFELTASQHHRFNRVADRMTGSVEDLPFTQERQSVVRWTNIYSAADPISSKLYAPGNKKPPNIEQIEIFNQLEPNPSKAHSGYFSSNAAVAHIHDAIMLWGDKASLPSAVPKNVPFLAHRAVFGFKALLVLISWGLFAVAGLFWAGRAEEMQGGLLGILALFVLGALLWTILRVANRRYPLTISQNSKPT